MLPLLGALTVCIFVILEIWLSFKETRAQQAKLHSYSRLRDGIFDLYQSLNACERFNASYLLARSDAFLNEYSRRAVATRKLLEEQRSDARAVLHGDLVLNSLFHSAERRLDELDGKIEESRGLAGPDLDRVLRSAPTQPMSRFRLSHLSANATLRDLDHNISATLVHALDRRGLLLISGALICALLIALAFFELNSALRQSQQLLAGVQLAEQRYHLLANRVQDKREEENASLARRVHDDLGQSLTAAKIDLAMALRIAETDPQGVNRQIRRAMDSLDSAVRDIRRVSTELRPGILDQMGLEPALEWLVQEFGQRTALAVDFQCSPGIALGEKGDIVVFRIAQEALTNIARHAQATRVTIRGVMEAGAFVLSIQDNGVGFAKEKLNDAHSIGLFGMRDRAAAAGGVIDVYTEQGMGTVVRVLIPVPKHQESVRSVVA
ncbi:MAG: hypothetical protein JNK48_14095 [Bryobacterales bacterium]|nr:hypothetical protein [Bryobacterales bacterium]